MPKSNVIDIDTKAIYEICSDIPMRKTDCVCKRCDKKMQVWGEVTSISWNDYFDGSGEMIDLCESCAKFVVGKIKETLKSGNK